MPGYYDHKVRICTEGAIANAKVLLKTMDAVDMYLHPMWEEGNNSFPSSVNSILAGVVGKIDEAEEALVEARLRLDTLFPGHPKIEDIE